MRNVTLRGLSFAVEIVHDSDMGEPWKEHDGYGVVSDWVQRGKRPSERTLCADRRSYRYYDVAATQERARKDGWGLTDSQLDTLAAKLGHRPNSREIAAESTEQDFERVRAWLNNEWYWVGVVVTLLDVDGNETDEGASLWGIESDAGTYLDDVARELAGEIADRIGDETTTLTHTTVVREVSTNA